MWAPRRSTEQSRDVAAVVAVDEHSSGNRGRKSDPTMVSEARPRSSSDTEATPRPTAPTPRFLATNVENANLDRLNGSRGIHTSRFAHLPHIIHSTLHSASHSASHSVSQPTTQIQSHTTLPAPESMASATSVSSSKIHPSPSKASYGRTYDSKLVTREMHRLAHLPVTLAQVATAQVAPGSQTTTSQPAAVTGNHDNPWGALHVHVLPLFNGEPLRIPIEDLNVLVKRHIQAVVSAAPQKALATLDNDAAELIASGMVTLNSKLVGIDDSRLLSKVVEKWGFFWDQVLPYVEGVLLPLQTDPLLQSLYRTPKRPSSPTRTHKTSISSLSSPAIPSIDVRTVALRSFRDKVIVPLHARLAPQLHDPAAVLDATPYQQPRLQQMLLVLASQARNHRPRPAFSLNAPAAQPTHNEEVVDNLLHALTASTHTHGGTNGPVPRGNQTFISGGVPRDRRGRVALKPHVTMISVDDKHPASPGEIQREREKEFLDSLKSPVDISEPITPVSSSDVSTGIDGDTSTVRASVGGWGLGQGNEDSSSGRMSEDDDSSSDGGDDEDDGVDWAVQWDQAQADVERMVGMRSDAEPPTPIRRRIT